MSQHTLYTCVVCDAPLRVESTSRGCEVYRGRNGVKLELGYSRGGWGWRRDWLNWSSEEVCDECFTALEGMLRPIVEFVRGGRRREGDQVSPMRGDEPSPGGPKAPLLRALPSLRRKAN